MSEPNTDARLGRLEGRVEQLADLSIEIADTQRRQTDLTEKIHEVLAGNQYMGQRVGALERTVEMMTGDLHSLRVEAARHGERFVLLSGIGGAIGAIAIAVLSWWLAK